MSTVPQAPDGDSDWAGTWQDMLGGGPKRWKDGEDAGNFQVALDAITSRLGATELSILIPLAGDTPFVAFAWSQGHHVTALEKVPEAAEQLRKSFPEGTKWHVPRQVGGLELWEVDTIEFVGDPFESGLTLSAGSGPRARIYVGDAFEFVPELESGHDVSVDKDSFGAIPPARRNEYVQVMASYLKPGGVVYLEGKDKPEDQRDAGPPWHLEEGSLTTCWEPAGVKFVDTMGELYKLSRPGMRQISYWLAKEV